MFLFMTSMTLTQACWTFTFTSIGREFLNTYDWELNRKRGPTVMLEDEGSRKKRKKRKLENLPFRGSTKFQISPELVDSIKSVFFENSNEKHGLMLERWKKEVSTRCMIATTHSYQANLQFTYQDYDSDTIDQGYLEKQALTVHQQNLPIVFDTGASMSISPIREDFLGNLYPAPIASLQGLKDKVKIVGIGTVRWMVYDNKGITREIKTKAYYIPEGNIRLLSPQSYIQENGGRGHARVAVDCIEFTLADGTMMTFPYNPHSNIPLMLTKEKEAVGLSYTDVSFLAKQNVASYLSVAAEINQNITASQKELLLWHWRLGHASFKRIQWLFAVPRDKENDSVKPTLISKNPKVSSCKNPLCVACQIAKQTRRGAETIHHSAIKQKEMSLRRNNIEPGDMVSLDQYMSALPGRLSHTKGKEKKKDQYCGGTIFVDHASSKVFVKNQVSLNAGETVMAKRMFERDANNSGVQIKAYRADNVPFNCKEFLADIESKGQTISLSGVGAHHQNGVSERAIKTITSWARAMLMHMVIHWPDCSDLALWPFALNYSVFIWNHLPKQESGLCPEEIFTSTRIDVANILSRIKVWGCPTYVLDPTLQDGKKLPKWHPRSRRGQFLGFSNQHSSTVGLVLNLRTGHISPQYHVVYDELYSTVTTTEYDLEALQNNHVFTLDRWSELLVSGYERSQVLEDAVLEGLPLPELNDEWLSPREIADREALRRNRQARRRLTRESQEPIVHQPPPIIERIVNQPVEPLVEVPEGAPIEAQVPEQEDASVSSHESIQEARPPSRGRARNKNRKYFGNEWVNYQTSRPLGASQQKVRREVLNSVFLQTLVWNRPLSEIVSKDFLNLLGKQDLEIDLEHGTVEWLHPMVLAAKANSEDTPNWEQAMNGPEKAGYWKAMTVEYETLEVDKDSWEIMDREDWMNVLPSTWAFRCKRFPDGTVRKLKARFCVRGDMQIEGVDYFDTYAPVVNWQTVRLMLILSIILGLATKQVDYTAAFVHADIDRDPNWDNMTEEQRSRSGVYIHMPRGFMKPGKVLKLKKSLYGLKQAPRNFFLHLKAKLMAVGFRSLEEVDACLFVTDNVICLVYVDDTLFFSPKEEYIDEVISNLRAQGMDLEVEGDVGGFLGVHIERNKEDNTIILTQSGLAKRIIEALDIEDLPPKHTPASAIPLVKDEDGEMPDCTFNYSSVVGMLQYLQGHSRPDITYAVSQCARFVHSPKRIHEEALMRIGQYLKGTVDKGLILRPSGKLTVDCFVDADFAGMWPYEDKNDPTCVKSRTGFVICLSDCPIVWSSKLQQMIATSTMEAEYNALSVAMRDVLPFKHLVKEIATVVGYDESEVTTFRTTVWEDNVGALTLANLEPGRVTPRSKFYAVKMHWFRSQLQPNNIIVVKVATKDQKADIMTKGLRKEKFVNNRQLLCGW